MMNKKCRFLSKIMVLALVLGVAAFLAPNAVMASYVNPNNPDAGYNDPVNVDRTPADERFIIESTVENGSISPAGKNSVLAGADYSVTYQAMEGYKLSSVTVDGAAVDAASFANGYLFSNVRAAHTIHVVFAKTTDPVIDPNNDDPNKDPNRDPNRDPGKDPKTDPMPTPNPDPKLTPTPDAKPTVVPAKPAVPVKKPIIVQTVIPTGDSAPVVSYGLLLGLAVGALVLLRRRCR